MVVVAGEDENRVGVENGVAVTGLARNFSCTASSGKRKPHARSVHETISRPGYSRQNAGVGLPPSSDMQLPGGITIRPT